MSIFIKHCRAGSLAPTYNIRLWRLKSTSVDTKQTNNNDEEEFRVLDILQTKTRQQRRVARRADIQPDRADRMPTDQNWGNVWPGPKTFHHRRCHSQYARAMSQEVKPHQGKRQMRNS